MVVFDARGLCSVWGVCSCSNFLLLYDEILLCGEINPLSQSPHVCLPLYLLNFRVKPIDLMIYVYDNKRTVFSASFA